MLKPLDKLCDPDERHRFFVRITQDSNEPVPLTLNEYYDAIDQIRLTGLPPEGVENHFEIARNLFLYSWFVYEFTTPAQSQAYGSVEYALRERWKLENGRIPGFSNLRHLLKIAIDRHWISDREFPTLQLREQLHDPRMRELLGLKNPVVVDENPQAYCHVLLKTLPKIRNNLAHGTSNLDVPSGALFSLGICAGIINQVYP